ncbi:GTP-binding protein HflX [Orbus hercynius]|uniref:GTPase HflX n=1 Tax=Orbus hercynius TaxID=593135 RepID=A0A495RAX2_9GAMM|nr:ribosome rescue GTPase HflX [Orbus hercynius]RKS84481.1 GTP-binding protein HflX [Orbus hercynius]
MFERHKGGEKALLVHVFLPQDNDIEDLNEFEVLVSSAHIEILDIITTSRKAPSAKYFIGEGKATEIAALVKEHDAAVILVNHSLTPTQERNLEKLCECKVVDRTGVILDIFAQRARTHEGKLQVELAQLQYISTRLVRGWTHLERQKGGIGLRGPGETQLETDRRLIRHRIQLILSRLDKVAKQREQNRQSRIKADLSTISLVGYTNAGKSTLFNAMTDADVYTANQLFATLDPTLRRIAVDDVGDVVIADTVGFIRHLPHNLVAAFKATLLETKEAALLLHVIDASDPNQFDNIQAVNEVLFEIEAHEIPTLLVMNKIDLLEEKVPSIDRDENGVPIRVWLSAQNKVGLDLLLTALKERLAKQIQTGELHIPAYLSRLRSRFYQLKAVEQEIINEDGSFNLNIRLPLIEWNRLCKQESDLLYLINEHSLVK